MGKCHIHLIVRSLINSSEMFGKLFDERNKDETNERVRDTALYDDDRYFLYQTDSNDGNRSDGCSKGENTLSEGKLVLLHLSVTVTVRVLVFVGFEDGVIDALMGSHLEENIDGVGKNEEDGSDA